MKSLLIIVILLIPFLGTGQSAASNAQAQPAPVAAMSESYANRDMVNTFTANSLSKPQVNSFQDRGVQKLKDFYNYLAIIANQKYDKKLREEAKKQALALFETADCTYKNMKIEAWLDTCFSGKSVSKWSPSDFQVTQPLNVAADDTLTHYSGEISYKVTVNSTSTGDASAKILLVKTIKHFGNRTEDIWTVFLCSID